MKQTNLNQNHALWDPILKHSRPIKKDFIIQNTLCLNKSILYNKSYPHQQTSTELEIQFLKT